MSKSIVITSLVTMYLVIYHVLFLYNASFRLLAAMFVLSPFLVGWMAYTILKDKNYKSRELEEGEEWGYADRDRSSLGTF